MPAIPWPGDCPSYISDGDPKTVYCEYVAGTLDTLTVTTGPIGVFWAVSHAGGGGDIANIREPYEAWS